MPIRVQRSLSPMYRAAGATVDPGGGQIERTTYDLADDLWKPLGGGVDEVVASAAGTLAYFRIEIPEAGFLRDVEVYYRSPSGVIGAQLIVVEEFGAQPGSNVVVQNTTQAVPASASCEWGTANAIAFFPPLFGTKLPPIVAPAAPPMRVPGIWGAIGAGSSLCVVASAALQDLNGVFMNARTT